MVTKDIHANGTGTIWFGNVPWWVILLGNDALDTFVPSSVATVVFYDIPNAQSVYELVNELKAA